MKVIKKTSYNIGGKVKKRKSKVTQKAGTTAEGDKMPELRKDPVLSEATRNRGADVEDIKTNTKEANTKINEVLKALKALTPEEAKGEKGKVLKNQLRILRDSKRGPAAKQSHTRMNARGEYYVE
jgi:hypothetical protein